MTNQAVKRITKSIVLFLLIISFAQSSSAQDDYSKALEAVRKRSYSEAKKLFESAAYDSPRNAFEYSLHLLDGRLGERDTALALLYLADLASYGNCYVGDFSKPFLKGEEKIFESDMDSDEQLYQAKAIELIKTMEPLKGSKYYSIILDAIGKCYCSEGDFIKAEKAFKDAINTKTYVNYYCKQDPRLSLGIFYLLIDCDYVDDGHLYDDDNDEGIPFDNLGIVNSSSLRLYKYRITRDEKDNTTYWLECYKKNSPSCFDSYYFTVMNYSLNDILYGIYAYGIPNNPKDHDKAMRLAGELFLSEGFIKFEDDNLKKTVADYYYDNISTTQAWELYRLADFSYGLGKCYYKDRDYSSAIKYLSKALTEEISDCSKEEIINALSLISSMYRYGRGSMKIDELLAEKLLEASKKYNTGNYKLSFTTRDGIIDGIEIQP